MSNIEIRLGAIHDVAEQLKGTRIDEKTAKELQKDNSAITRLLMRGIITDSECRKAHDRLFKRIQRELISANE